jgi:hypothetical protein
MRKAKILIKSFEELKEIFSEEEMKKTFNNLVSVFSLSELKLWFGSNIQQDADIIEESDYNSSCAGYAVLHCQKNYQHPVIELYSQTNGEYLIRFDTEVDITVDQLKENLSSLLSNQQEEIDITVSKDKNYEKDLSQKFFEQDGKETFNIYLHPSAWTEAQN